MWVKKSIENGAKSFSSFGSVNQGLKCISVVGPERCLCLAPLGTRAEFGVASAIHRAAPVFDFSSLHVCLELSYMNDGGSGSAWPESLHVSL